jgi:hypothetical protein
MSSSSLRTSVFIGCRFQATGRINKMPLRCWALVLAVNLSFLAYGMEPQTPQAQQPVPTPFSVQAPPPQGVQAPWDVKQMLADLNSENEKLEPLIARMHPQQWLDNGAPPAYASQYLEARARMDDQIRAIKRLSLQTDSPSVAIDTYFRMEAFEIIARSLNECIRKYGDRDMAEELARLIALEFTNRQRFREYLRDLSTERDQEFKIADEEAQRCRGMISGEPQKFQERKSRRK